MLNETEIKIKIQELIEKYEAAKSTGSIKKYTEEETKKDFILPLFEALGWDVHYKREVSAEEHIKSSGRVDYGFYLDNRIQFYLEAKSLKIDLNKEEYARQAIRYAWNRGVTWAVLTDFEHIKVFNTQDVKASLGSKLLFDVPYNQYLERFEQLYLLSKVSFADKLLDKYAEEHGKKLQKVPISSLLYNDLNECREMLIESLANWNEKLKKDRKLLDEGVQKLLDRLIFLRVAEDRSIEQSTLIPLVREWEASKSKNEVPLYTSMVSKFREMNETYNSNLFTPHPFEGWEEYDGTTAKVIQILYGKPGYYEYDFKAMPADVLGTVYENYLGYKLSQSKKGVEIHKDAKKRKEQGIYYTPHFIVEYIVQNALGPVLEKCRTIEDVKKVKVLDPACGSGSFLVQALELINEKYKKMGAPGNIFTKIQILLENIYGVDLDEQAVEITRLNLLVSVLDGKYKFPLLDQNIKNGNSLISGTDMELKKYFGADFREKKVFNWKEEFPSVFKQGGFDAVIGNPPWVSNDNISSDEKEFFKNSYQVADSRFDLANIFVEQSLIILKENGILGFVMPEHVWIGEYFRPLRTYLEKNSSIMQILSSKEGNFAQVANPSSVFLTEKFSLKSTKHKIILGSFSLGKLEKYESDVSIKERVIFDEFISILRKKIETMSFSALGEMAIVTDGIQTANLLREIFTQNPKNEENCFKALRSGAAIKSRYAPISWQGWWVLKPELTRDLKRPGFSYDSPKRIKCFGADEKIILRQTEPTILATLDKDHYFFPNSIFQIVLENVEPKRLRFLLGVLNSKFLRFYYSRLSQVEGTTKPQLYLNILKSLPIPNFDGSISVLVDEILNLNEKLLGAEENSNKWERLKSEIEKIDRKIDQEVYKLYGLTPEEIKIVEGGKEN